MHFSVYHCTQAARKFTHERQRYTYNRMPQGFKNSPSIFNRLLKEDLTGLELDDGVTILQYVGDILIAAPTSESCLKATEALMTRVAKCGYKIKKEKLQLARRQVTFLGRVISGGKKGVSFVCSTQNPKQSKKCWGSLPLQVTAASIFQSMLTEPCR